MIRIPDQELKIGDELDFEGKNLKASALIKTNGGDVKKSGSKYYCRQDHGAIIVFEIIE